MSRYARSCAFQSRLVVRTLSIASNDLSARGIVWSRSFSGLGEEAVERAVVVVDRLVERLQLVAADGRRGVVVRALAQRRRSRARRSARWSRPPSSTAWSRCRGRAPSAGAGGPRARPRGPRGTPRSPSAGSAASRGRCRRSRRAAATFSVIVRGRHQAALGVDDGLPVALLLPGARSTASSVSRCVGSISSAFSNMLSAFLRSPRAWRTMPRRL